MSELLNGFGFSFAKWDATIAACACGLWLVILGCAITSIREQDFGPAQRRLWMAAVILVPILGLLAYLPFCFQKKEASLRGWVVRNRLAPRNRPGGPASSES